MSFLKFRYIVYKILKRRRYSSLACVSLLVIFILVFNKRSTVLTSNCTCPNKQLPVVQVTPQEHSVLVEISLKDKLVHSYHLSKGVPLRTTCDWYSTLLRHGGIKKRHVVFSVSLFGRESAFSRYLTIIAKELRDFYRNSDMSWTLRVYHDARILKPCDFACLDVDIDLCDVSKIPATNHLEIGDESYLNWARLMNGMMWRWMPLGDDFVDVFLCRDADSLVIQREVDAINEWLNDSLKATSSLPVHIMRDHPGHDLAIPGGMWALASYRDRDLARQLFEMLEKHHAKILNAKNKKDFNFKKLSLLQFPDYFFDKNFLATHFWPVLKYHALVHDSYHCLKYSELENDDGSTSKSHWRPFPTQRVANCYIGCPMHKQVCCNLAVTTFIECPVECRPEYGKGWEYC